MDRIGEEDKLEPYPGPWRWINGEYECGGFCTPDGCGGHNNGLPMSLEPVGISLDEEPDLPLRWIATAQVIKSAPDVLAAAELLLARLDELYAGKCGFTGVTELRAAVNKAREGL